MNDTDIESSLRTIIATILGHSVSPDVMRDNEACWDSLKHMQIVFAVEEHFTVHFLEEEIPTLTSIKAFADTIVRHNAAQHNN